MNESADESPHHATAGRYANYFEIGHNAFEFLVDFGHATPDDATPTPHTRVVMSPGTAREFLRVLHGSVAEFERKFGSIPPMER